MGDNPKSDLIAAPQPSPACAQVAWVAHRLSTGRAVAHFVHMPSRAPGTGLSTVVQLFADRSHLALEAHVLTRELGDLFDRVQRCGVVPTAEGAADDRER